MGWAVLLVWGESEGNQKPGVLAGEYLLSLKTALNSTPPLKTLFGTGLEAFVQ